MSTSDNDKQDLQAIVGGALAMTPRQLRRDLAEKATGTSEPAQRKVSEAVTEAVLTHFDVRRKDDDTGPATGRAFLPKDEDADDD